MVSCGGFGDVVKWGVQPGDVVSDDFSQLEPSFLTKGAEEQLRAELVETMPHLSGGRCDRHDVPAVAKQIEAVGQGPRIIENVLQRASVDYQVKRTSVKFGERIVQIMQ